MPCYVSRRQMLDYLEGRLLDTEARSLERHLVSCDVCRELSGILEQELKPTSPPPATPPRT